MRMCLGYQVSLAPAGKELSNTSCQLSVICIAQRAKAEAVAATVTLILAFLQENYDSELSFQMFCATYLPTAPPLPNLTSSHGHLLPIMLPQTETRAKTTLSVAARLGIHTVASTHSSVHRTLGCMNRASSQPSNVLLSRE
jgi:hypothetical protein